MIIRVAVALAFTGAATIVWAAPAVAQDLTHFRSPSGNVGCVLDVDYVRCDISERDWAPPARPADCEFDYGQGLQMAVGEPATFVCAGDTTLGGADVLGYGQTITRGALSCTSTESAMSCREGDGGHGFSISRQVYQVF
ncbi:MULTISPECIES: DUF6636 domain-containing protein [Mycobacteriaceae]|uniref:Uncharacterized protein n=1 Tax=Mycolicibacterium neoaurum VKM Ac-1815D TaxID=700508 RepID=V5XD32_MYCNE|nr:MULTISPECIES: DUF6636 domain-containing protein [Mycobacteriaceae]AHC25329.1 hypothetical protein D174_12370 [Mycolicibacterium neoaurum VKM Ac-1815D]AMO05804.1 hypothetical protein MyAD_12135 [Mycolicibacterium neoaurum]AXK75862.1 hypothetical protein DXK33_12860 [Mycolicibacterium neoaurum]KJQ47971.1 hypothetical protein TS71_24185 [Mycolicibacterium neoaurum]KUM05999.1 hypothetical protein AVZ31_24035 [Mycolicibacterium neoaurum]